jgi:hypothetical protein
LRPGSANVEQLSAATMFIAKFPEEKSFGGDAGLEMLLHDATDTRRATPANGRTQ